MRKIVYLAFSLLTFYLAGVYRLDVLMFLFTVNLFTYMFAMSLSRCRNVILERERRATWAQDAAIEGEL